MGATKTWPSSTVDADPGADRARLSVGVAFPGDPFDPRTWSGTPSGLCGGLRTAGVNVVPLNLRPAPLVDFVSLNTVAALRLHRAWRGFDRETIRFARAVARASPELGWVQSGAARRARKTVERLDGLLRIGTGYTMPPHDRTIVFDDLTVLQAVELGYPEWLALSKRAVRLRMDRQRRIYERAHAICLTTAWARDGVIRDYGIPADRVFAVGVGRNHDTKVEARDWSTPRFLFIGTNWYGKNGEAVVSAFRRVRELVPDAELHLVGDHPDLRLDGVHCHGSLRLDLAEHRARMADLFRASTCFVLPSRYEASAIAYVEAGGAGLPCIATKAGGAGQLIGDAGFLVHPTEHEELFESMLELTDPERARQLGELAEARAHLFTWDMVAGRVLRALDLPGVAADDLPEFI
jgi:glycosyltransferase involved in cell wall biosynthesis